MTTQELTGLTETQRAAMELLQPLTESERLEARDAARALVKMEFGAKPDRAAFDHATAREYPAWLTRAINIMLVFAFAGAFVTSSFSVFSAGRNHAADVLHVDWQAAAAGVAIVLLAEFLTIASVLTMNILLQGQRRRLLMVFPTALGVVIAITGNAVMAAPSTFFDWLVTVAPPVSVVFLSLILEAVALDDIKRRHANERAYQAALADWQKHTADPERSPAWRMKYATALKEAIAAKAASGRGKTEREALMASMTGADWSAVVWREYQADHWLEDMPVNFPQSGQPQAARLPEITPVQTMRPPAPALASTNGNGNHNGRR